MSRHHDIPPRPENMVWGYLDAHIKPVLSIKSGDTVGLTSWAAADEDDLPSDRSMVNPGHLEAMQVLKKEGGGHMITGPVNVEDAEPGDVLQIDILEAKPADSWGYTDVYPLAGTLPYDFETAHRSARNDRSCLSTFNPGTG